MISDRKADRPNTLNAYKNTLICIYYIAHASPQPFSNYTNAIIAKRTTSHNDSLYKLPTLAAILFCDITKSSENVIADIVH